MKAMAMQRIAMIEEEIILGWTKSWTYWTGYSNARACARYPLMADGGYL